ncbi:dephospho-CoA kinase [Marinomonas sp. A79]|uniref:Dephospho-CoA kinase n=1 Tax=Marinomonas vulgaris TaxID=2823372 RepID=A0ABS5HC31_9GAMM|nr:dephospho-CoA kinase [Marinomonas vulgaris]MBR7888599.1 dephospho-CoA kinase [Marinomonas vulgaris]
MEKHVAPIIGLAGGIGSGKSTIAKCFNRLGIQSVDADDVARFVVQPGTPCLQAIKERYGDSILTPLGELNRPALRDIVFNTPDERRWLESVTHPAIRQELALQLSATTSSYCLLVHPLLFETKQNLICRYVIAIDVPVEIQTERVINRDKVTLESAKKIMATQLSNQDRIDRADFSFENSGNIDNMDDKVSRLHKKILESISC